MKPERRLVAERPLAQHCPELLRPAPVDAPFDPAPDMARLGLRLSRALAPALAPLLGGNVPMVTCAEPRTCGVDALTVEIAPFAANSLLAMGERQAGVLASLDGGAVLRIVDRAFGGRGEAPDPLPEAFPLSAELMVKRMETLVAEKLGQALGLSGDTAPRPLRRETSLEQLAPFAANCQLMLLVLSVAEADQTPWDLVLAFPMAELADLLGAPASSGSAASPAQPRRAPASPADAPYADVPLPLTAVIVDMQVPFSTLARLTVGQILPVAVARNVPLRIGEVTVGHGSVGAVDDCVAVQLNQIF